MTAFEESGDYPGIIPDAADYTNVPGWASLETFLRVELGINHRKSIETFRKFYNHYLKNFPVHYFSAHTIPQIDFALFFPVRGGKGAAQSPAVEPHYLVAISEKNGRTMLFHRKLSTSLKSRHNFYRMTHRWAENGFKGQRFNGTDISEILRICENPESLLALREQWFSRFLEKLERKLHKMKQERPFKDKWGQIYDFIRRRDAEFLHHITGKMKSEHIDFEAAHAAANVSQRNLDIYNWIMAGGSKQAIENRTRLVPYYPWLVQALSSDETVRDEVNSGWGPGGKYSEARINISSKYQELEKVIDNGEPLLDALEIFLSADDPYRPLRQSTIRKTMGLRIDKALLEPEKLTQVLRAVEKYVPSLALNEGWLEKIYEIQNGAETTFEYLGTSFVETLADMPPHAREEILNRKKGGVTEYRDTVDYMRQVYAKAVLPYFMYRAAQVGMDGLDEALLGHLTGKIWDRSFIETERNEWKHAPFLRPFGNMMVHNIVKLSVHWHDQLGRYTPKIRGLAIDSNVTWPVMTGTVTAPNDVEIMPLRSKRDLQKNHEEFGHCINTYTANCLGLVDTPGVKRTYSHAFRIAAEGRNGEKGTLVVTEPYYSNGSRRTIEMGEIDTKRVRYETRNPPPPTSPLVRAAEWYIDEINSGRLKVEWDRIDMERRGINTRAIDSITGFDATDFDKCREAFMALRPYLPENQRHYSYEKWISKMGFDKEADLLFNPAKQGISLSVLNRIEYG